MALFQNPKSNSQIISICDVFESLLSWRPYSDAESDKKTLSIMLPIFGEIFNPKLKIFFERSSKEMYLILK